MIQTKFCKGCEETYPKTKEYFYHNGKGFLTLCKTCHSLYANKDADKKREKERMKVLRYKLEKELSIG